MDCREKSSIFFSKDIGAGDDSSSNEQGKPKMSEGNIYQYNNLMTPPTSKPTTKPPGELLHNKMTAGNLADTSNTTGSLVFDPTEQSCASLGVSREVVDKSRYMGNTNRWHHVLKKLNKNNIDSKVKVAVLGGSVTAGHECADKQKNVPNFTCAWSGQLQSIFSGNDKFKKVEVTNLAHGGTPSSAGLAQVIGLTEYDVIM